MVLTTLLLTPEAIAAALLRAIPIVVFTLFLGFGVASGVRSRRQNEKAFAAHWTAGSELLAWQQRPVRLREEDGLSAILSLDLLLMAVLYTGIPCYLAFTASPLSFVPWVAAFCAGLAGPMAGALLQKYLARQEPRWLSIVDTGVISLGVFTPWEALSYFAVDTRRGKIRVYGRAPAEVLVEVLLPPGPAEVDRASEILGRHLPSTRPDVKGRWPRTWAGWRLCWIGLVALKAGGAIVPPLVLEPALACVVMAGCFLVFNRLSLAAHKSMLGYSVSRPGEGLTIAGSASG